MRFITVEMENAGELTVIILELLESNDDMVFRGFDPGSFWHKRGTYILKLFVIKNSPSATFHIDDISRVKEYFRSRRCY
jgi:hypothetical protein